MSKRAEAVEAVRKLSDELGLESDLSVASNMKTVEIEKRVQELEALKTIRNTKKAEVPEAPKNPVTTGDQPRHQGGTPRYPYQVAPGHEVICKRGKLSGGREVKPGDVSGGQKGLDALVAAGHVMRAPRARAAKPQG
jgi:hypothetical protein